MTVERGARPGDGRDDDDATLVARALGGDGDAFRRLHDRHAPALLAFLRRSLGPQGADEALADSFVRAHSALASFDRTRSFGAWLVGIARNVTREHARRPAPREEDAREGSSGVDEVERREDVTLLVEVMACLTERERAVVRMRFREGKTLIDVAAELGCSRRTVANLQRSALARLSAELRARRAKGGGA